ncbi:hypothetical protein ABAC460_20795 [Asticcacaulis sp. AC460]|uniref:endonuclease domain-containing protein n=1 Tax=Asticcacaulis sp. AC460 TaxID=1282360 RepID=UPI0003C3BC8E|nr:DUF559 domain-containing protein [Asticcacaulis sp. AC460]ESQ87212.1 hypothetical protein ABAC460_20795 [Asticcacaulis sp. AC460]
MKKPLRKYAQARRMRQEMTSPEVRLWSRIKAQERLHFRKQHPVGPYIADFYCAAAKLIIEVDGQVHGTGDIPERDQRRDAWLMSQGYHVHRIPGFEIMAEPDEIALGVITLAESMITK